MKLDTVYDVGGIVLVKCYKEAQLKPCSNCNGTGGILVDKTAFACPSCNGWGQEWGNPSVRWVRCQITSISLYATITVSTDDPVEFIYYVEPINEDYDDKNVRIAEIKPIKKS